MSNALRSALLFLITVYRTTVSAFTGCTCRFEPSCSAYAETAFRRFTLRRAFVLTLARILRCHPLGGRGYDPVPERTLL